MTKKSFNCIIYGLICAVCTSCLASQPRAAVAYQIHGTVYLADKAGNVLNTIHTRPKAHTFAVSLENNLIMFAPQKGRGAYASYGGQLYVMSLDGNAKRRLSNGPYNNMSAGSTEVYSDPDFSPDGKSAVFSVHSQAYGDLVEASGPFAVVDIESGYVRILPSTLHVKGDGDWGTAFAGPAYWSPDGTQILLNFEAGSAVTDSRGVGMKDVPGPDSWWTTLAWLGNRCVVEIAGNDSADAETKPAVGANIVTGKVSSLQSLLGLSAQQATGLVAISGTMRVRWVDGKLLVETNHGQWFIPGADADTEVRLLPADAEQGVPSSCR